MKLFSFILLFLFSLVSVAQKQKQIYEDTLIKCIYETNKGKLQGKYVSYYKNGKKKAKGTFENNYRTGKWTVWENSGRVQMQRIYSDPFTFKRTVPKTPKDKVIKLVNIPQYTLKYNKEGFIEYFILRERAVMWAMRVGRFISLVDNKILFEQNKLFSLLNKQVTNKNVEPYNVTNKINLENLFTKDIDTSFTKLIGYKIDEDCFFDNERLVFETRIIGICPVVVNILESDTVDLYWVPYTKIRQYLAQENIARITLPVNIKTLDDLFFYRFFYGQILRKSYVPNQMFPKYQITSEMKNESKQMEIELIEKEHDLWISLTE